MMTSNQCKSRRVPVALAVLSVVLPAGSRVAICAAQRAEEVEDATGRYHFLSPDDTLALLDEDGKLKGYLDVAQSEEESDTVLSYTIAIGTRKRESVEFKTNKIHQRYYRFAGKVQRGLGRGEKDSDFLRLVGDLEIVTVNSETGKESVERRHVVLKSIGKGEREED